MRCLAALLLVASTAAAQVHESLGFVRRDFTIE